MIHRTLPVSESERRPLVIRDGDQGHIVEFAIEWRKICQIEPAMQSSHLRHRGSSRERKVQVIDMKMNDIEIGGMFE